MIGAARVGVFSGSDAIPDASATRTDDNNSSSLTGDFGLRIKVGVEWPSIDVEMSSLTDNATRIYCYRVGDGQLLDDVDITGFSSGDVFRFEDVNLQPFDGTDDTKYNLTTDAEGSSYTLGFNNNVTFPVGPSEIEIINGSAGASGTDPNANAFKSVGNLQ